MPTESERTKPSEKTKIETVEAKISELERTVKALIEGFKAVEKYDDEAFVPAGKYFDVEFE